MSRDPFADVLALTEATSALTRGVRARGRWSLRFPAPGKVKFFAVARGRCWLRVEGAGPDAWIEEGDVVLLSGQHAFALADAPDTAPVDAHRVLGRATGPFVEVGDGGQDESLLFSGVVSLHASSGALLGEALPSRVHVRASSPRAAPLRWVIEQLIDEQRSDVPGAAAAVEQLAQLLFIQSLRAHIASAGGLPIGRLRAIADPQIAPSLRLMHADPARAWSLAELAKAAAMSRTSFATRFKATAGMPPLTYLTDWRMRLAQKRLRDGDDTIAEIADDLGYASDSAFSTAFKRVTGSAPRAYRKRNRG